MRLKGNFPSLVSYEIKCRKFSSRLDVRDWIGEVLTLVSRHKHCQRHNGPEGWVLLTKITSLGHITNSYTNHDQTSSESRPSTNFKISTKHQYFDKTWPNLASESRPRLNLITTTKHQLTQLVSTFSQLSVAAAKTSSSWYHSKPSSLLNRSQWVSESVSEWHT